MNMNQIHRIILHSSDFTTIYSDAGRTFATAFIAKFNAHFGTSRTVVSATVVSTTYYGCPLFNYDGSDSDYLYLMFQDYIYNNTHRAMARILYTLDGGTTFSIVNCYYPTFGNSKEPSATSTEVASIFTANYTISNKYPICICFFPVPTGYALGSMFDTRSDVSVTEATISDGVPKTSLYFLKCKDSSGVISTGIVSHEAYYAKANVPKIESWANRSLMKSFSTVAGTNATSFDLELSACRIMGEAIFDVYICYMPTHAIDIHSGDGLVSFFFTSNTSVYDQPIAEFIQINSKKYLTTFHNYNPDDYFNIMFEEPDGYTPPAKQKIWRKLTDISLNNWIFWSKDNKIHLLNADASGDTANYAYYTWVDDTYTLVEYMTNLADYIPDYNGGAAVIGNDVWICGGISDDNYGKKIVYKLTDPSNYVELPLQRTSSIDPSYTYYPVNFNNQLHVLVYGDGVTYTEYIKHYKWNGTSWVFVANVLYANSSSDLAISCRSDGDTIYICNRYGIKYYTGVEGWRSKSYPFSGTLDSNYLPALIIVNGFLHLIHNPRNYSYNEHYVLKDGAWEKLDNTPFFGGDNQRYIEHNGEIHRFYSTHYVWK